MPKLIITQSYSSEHKEISLMGPSFSIGRGADSDLALMDPKVSRDHARILQDDQHVYIMDLGSGNGTELNGYVLPPNEKTVLRHQDRIVMGTYTLIFNDLEQALNNSFNDVTDSDVLEVKLLKKVLRAIDKDTKPTLEVATGVAEGKKFFLEEDFDEGVIGRDPNADFPIEEYVISRRHAKVTRRADGAIYLSDLGSKNGTYLNNSPISEARLQDGDRISLGTITLIYRNPLDVNLDVINRAKAPVKRKPKKAAPPPSAEDAVDDLPDQPLGYPATEDNPADDDDISQTGNVDQGGVQQEYMDDYPSPHLRKGFTAMEWGLMGLGALTFFIAAIFLVRVLSS